LIHSFPFLFFLLISFEVLNGLICRHYWYRLRFCFFGFERTVKRSERIYLILKKHFFLFQNTLSDAVRCHAVVSIFLFYICKIPLFFGFELFCSEKKC